MVIFLTLFAFSTSFHLQAEQVNAEEVMVNETIEIPVISNAKNSNPIDSIWDFDHQLQYKQQRINSSSWRIEVVRHKNTPFERMATFMFRKAYDLCSNYRFVIEVEEGVELFTDRKAMPNMIFGNLETKVICLSENTESGEPVE